MVNLVQAARLTATTKVELVTFLYTDTGTTTERVDYVLVEPAEIAALVAALNTPVTIGMAPACVAEHEVRFARADGVIATFVYQCGAEEAKFLRGSTSDGSFQLGGEVVLPIEAGEILARTFAAPAAPVAPQPPPTATLLPNDPLRQDAAAIAGDLGITPDEALRRLQLQDEIGDLDARLAAGHPDTFAGLWIQHEPVYRIVVAFTRDGEATIRPYVAGTLLEPEIEVRTATATLEELQAAQAAARRQLDAIGLTFDSGINLPANQVELYVTDRALFAQRMAEAGLTLPAHVVVVTTYEPVGADPPFPITPVPNVSMPQLRVRSGAMMQALLTGTLLVEDGGLHVRLDEADTSYLVIWQPDYYLTDSDGTLEILDRGGFVVARVGEPIRLGGGATSAGAAEFNPQLQVPIPPSCGGPYWLMGQIEPR